jgi:hypothetical protein
MLLFSPLFFLLLCITPYQYKNYNNHYISPPLLHVPSKLGCYYDCILIYEWFYNNFHTYVLSHNTSSSYYLYNKQQQHRQKYKRKRHFHPFSLHHLLFFIYILLNLTITLGVHLDFLPNSFLGITPSLVCGYFIHL